MCEDEVADLNCPICDKNLCQDCSKSMHKKKQIHLNQFTKPKNEKANLKCLKHKQDILTFCVPCQQFLCLKCVLENGKHKEHQVKILQESNKEIEALNKQLQSEVKLSEEILSKNRTILEKEKEFLIGSFKKILDLQQKEEEKVTEYLKNIQYFISKSSNMLPHENCFKMLEIRQNSKKISEKRINELEKLTDRILSVLVDEYTITDEIPVIYNIATEFMTKSWSNPHDAKLIHVTVSSPNAGLSFSTHERDVVNDFNSPGYYGSPSQPNQWVQLQFRDYYVYPTGYRICNPRTGNCHPRSWKLEAKCSINNDWVLLDVQSNNKTLTDTCKKVEIPLGQNLGKFDCFRITQTGYSEGGFHHLCISGVEIYGVIEKVK